MLDPIIQQLNNVAKGKVASESISLPDVSRPQVSFESFLDDSVAGRLLEKIKEENSMNTTQGMTVLSADNIHVETQGVEGGTKTFSTSDKFFDLFRELNKDMVGLDTALETLTTPGLKFSAPQLLALQAGVANTTIIAETVSRGAGALTQTINTVFQTNV